MAGRAVPVNVESFLLTTKENKAVIDGLGLRCYTLCTTLGEVSRSKDDNKDNWEKVCSGIVCFVKDNIKRAYFIRVYDLQSKALVFELNTLQVTRRSQYEFIETKDGKLILMINDHKLEFLDKDEGCKFKAAFEDKLEARKKKRLVHQRQVTPTNISSDLPGKSLKVKVKKSDIEISKPINFRHVTGFNTADLDPGMRNLLKEIGIDDTDVDKETLDFIYDFVDKHGGINKVTKDVKGPPPVSKSGVPPPPPSYRSAGPPPPPNKTAGPPSNKNTDQAPQRVGPPPPPPNRNSGSPPPPPPSNKSSDQPPQRAGPPPPPLNITSGPPPPPPSKKSADQAPQRAGPPPPPPNRNAGPPPPPNKSTGQPPQRAGPPPPPPNRNAGPPPPPNKSTGQPPQRVGPPSPPPNRGVGPTPPPYHAEAEGTGTQLKQQIMQLLLQNPSEMTDVIYNMLVERGGIQNMKVNLDGRSSFASEEKISQNHGEGIQHHLQSGDQATGVMSPVSTDDGTNETEHSHDEVPGRIQPDAIDGGESYWTSECDFGSDMVDDDDEWDD